MCFTAPVGVFACTLGKPKIRTGRLDLKQEGCYNGDSLTTLLIEFILPLKPFTLQDEASTTIAKFDDQLVRRSSSLTKTQCGAMLIHLSFPSATRTHCPSISISAALCSTESNQQALNSIDELMRVIHLVCCSMSGNSESFIVSASTVGVRTLVNLTSLMQEFAFHYFIVSSGNHNIPVVTHKAVAEVSKEKT